MSFEKKEESDKKSLLSEENFINKVKKSKTNEEITDLYEKLNSYDNNIVLKNKESWEALVEQTYFINNNLILFIEYLRKNGYPHISYHSVNSAFLHFGLAYTLKNINTKNEIFNYLADNSGHGGFINLMEAYEVNNDKEMGLKLFKKFLRFCDFLVN